MIELTVDQAIEDAASDLPEGYVIELNIENGSAWINMYGPNGSDVEFPECVDSTLAEQIQDAMHSAQRLASE
tara:strand:- start:283 stop:498 length:216 start_codon:yes stop_codon:yes gene_type:complete